MENKQKIAILGDGGWGTTLAILLKNKGYSVTLWGVFKDNIDSLKKHRENRCFLPGIKISEDIRMVTDISIACSGASLVVLAIPSRFLRGVLEGHRVILKKVKADFINVAKGLEEGTLKRMSEVIYDVLGDVRLGVLSGPTIAPEVARGIPTACVTSSKDERFSKKVRDVFKAGRFRVYTNRDLVGVELGGSLKNIIAIAAGISDGLGFGTNTKAAILTRGLIEMMRLGVKMGGEVETFKGLSGLGDLITTCVSLEGRNRNFGHAIGEGKKPEELLKKSVMEIEGVWTVKAAKELGKKYKIDLPITNQVYSVLFEGKAPLAAVNELMMREPKAE